MNKKQRTSAPRRRNSTGTIYITSTMSKQNNDVTIECVCVVIRAHMLSAAKENVIPLTDYDIFKDTAFAHKGNEFKTTNAMTLVSLLSIHPSSLHTFLTMFHWLGAFLTSSERILHHRLLEKSIRK